MRAIINNKTKSKKIYFKTVATNTHNSSQNFWEICKPFFSDKHAVSENIILVDKDEIVNSDSTTAEHFNTYFNDITKTLDIYQWSQSAEPIFNDPLLNVIAKYSDHPSIIKIKNTFLVTYFSLPILILKLSINWLCH